MIRIIAKRDGFWRGGIEHSALPKEYPDDAFTIEQLAILKAEPMLLVDVLPDPGEPGQVGEPTGPVAQFGSINLKDFAVLGRNDPAPGSKVTLEDLDDLNTEQLVAVASDLGATLDPKADWFVLRDEVEKLWRAKAAAAEAGPAGEN